VLADTQGGEQASSNSQSTELSKQPQRNKEKDLQAKTNTIQHRSLLNKATTSIKQISKFHKQKLDYDSHKQSQS
jgi:hypothetical protein